jgi:hypothetical protein
MINKEKVEKSLTNKKREKIKEFNEKCRKRQLNESYDKSVVYENVIVFYKGCFLDIPKKYAKVIP